ncbi:iron-containing alcohol dehydrogenase [Amycolatopsis japonica]|uniref:iron-containing alcohol dehydrogenase n=1 Tax=Amycolatopsis japonica TaxID=208439 RepID=UPI00366C949D
MSIETISGAVQGFVQDGLAARVVFGNGASERLASHADRLGITSAVTVCTPSLKRRATRLGRSITASGAVEIVGFGDFDGEAARIAEAVKSRTAISGVVAVGGGAAIIVGRRLGGLNGLPVLAVPTSYAGEETSSERSDTPLPATIVYDPVLTTTLPSHVTATSTMAAIARACLVLCAGAGSPLTELTASEAIRYLCEGAYDAVLHPRGLVGRSRLLYGAHLSGLALAGAGETATAAVRAAAEIDDAIARALEVRRGDVTAALLAHRLSAAGTQRPLALAAVAAALRADDAVTGAQALGAELGAPLLLLAPQFDPARRARAAAAAQAVVERLELSAVEQAVIDAALSGRAPN